MYIGRWVAGLLVMVASMAQAASISIDDTSPNDTVTVSGGGFVNFMFGSSQFFVINGQDYNANAFSATVGEATPTTFSAIWGDSRSATSGSRTVYLVEDMTTGEISDIIDLSWTFIGVNGSGALTQLSGTFRSDTGPGSLGFLTGLENAGDVFLESSPIVLTVSDLSITVSSDSEQQTVPEPGSLWLVGMALAAVGWRRTKPRTVAVSAATS